jgi:hypothetical protein
MTKDPETSGFISTNKAHADFPLESPIQLSSKKKLTPTSSPSVTLSSKIVNPPIPKMRIQNER